MNLRKPCRRVRDERGATLILVAISMILLLWGGAFAVDLGLTTVGNRQVQAMADTAALDVARYLNVAEHQSELSLTRGSSEHRVPQRQAGQRRTPTTARRPPSARPQVCG